MESLHIQEKLRCNGLDATVKELLLKVSTDTYGLVQLNYTVDSPKSPAACECRGLIIDSGKDWEVVAFPFYRFFNEHEGHAAAVDLSRATLQEKLDGSLMILYWHPYLNNWQVATRGKILADGQVNQNNITFASLFWSLWRQSLVHGSLLQENTVYMFELVSPLNRVVKRYTEPGLYLIGARDNGVEYTAAGLLSLANQLGVHRPKTYSFESKDDIFRLIGELDATDEGFVLVDYTSDAPSFPRIKVKNPRYLALAQLVGAGTEQSITRKLVRLIRSGDIDELISYFPEYTVDAKRIRAQIDKLAADIDATYYAIENLKHKRKLFAAQALTTPYSHALFQMADDRVLSGAEYLAQLPEDKLAEWLTGDKS